MDPFSTAASIVTIIGGAVGLIAWLRQRQIRGNRPVAQAGPSAVKAEEQSGTKKERVSRRLIRNSSELADELRYLASQPRAPKDFEERRAAILSRLSEFREDIKPLLHDVANLDVEEQVRSLYRELDSKLPQLLNYNPPFVMILSEEEPTPSWEEQYRPIRASLSEHLDSLVDVQRLVTEHLEGGPPGTWGSVHIQQIRIEYYAANTAHCPLDGAVLTAHVDYSGFGQNLRQVHCPNCKRSAKDL